MYIFTTSHLIVRSSSSDIYTDVVFQNLALKLSQCSDNALECCSYVCEVGNAPSSDQHLVKDTKLTQYISKGVN